MDKKDIYNFLFEAPEDEETAAPEEAPVEDTPADDNPPDITDDAIEGAGDDIPAPPDLGEEDITDDGFGDDLGDEGELNNLTIDEKISSILNVNLYKNYLKLLSDIGTQLNTIKSNIDMFNAISDTTGSLVESIRKLEENLRLYMIDHFQNSRYENNQLFYDKCKSLYELLNDKFEKDVRKSIRHNT